MNYEDRDVYGRYKNEIMTDLTTTLMGAETLIGNDVYNQKYEDLGNIKEIMLDMRSGRVSYVVISFGSFLGMGEKLIAVPWSSLKLDNVNKRFILKIDKKRLMDAPGLDADKLPNMGAPEWNDQFYSYYGTKPGGL